MKLHAVGIAKFLQDVREESLVNNEALRATKVLFQNFKLVDRFLSTFRLEGKNSSIFCESIDYREQILVVFARRR